MNTTSVRLVSSRIEYNSFLCFIMN